MSSHIALHRPNGKAARNVLFCYFILSKILKIVFLFWISKIILSLPIPTALLLRKPFFLRLHSSGIPVCHHSAERIGVGWGAMSMLTLGPRQSASWLPNGNAKMARSLLRALTATQPFVATLRGSSPLRGIQHTHLGPYLVLPLPCIFPLAIHFGCHTESYHDVLRSYL